MLKKLFQFIAPYTEAEMLKPSIPLAQSKRGFFSTHFDLDEIDPKKKRTRMQNTWANALENIKQLIPQIPSQEGTGMDGSDDGISVKQAYSLSQPNISETLLMWYVSQSFIGHQMCAFLSQHWLIEKCCAMPARDAIRNGYEIVSADEKELPVDVLQEIKQHNEAFRLDGNMMEFIRHGRIFGIRILFFKVDSTDPDYYEKPFNIDGIAPGSYKGIVQCDPYWTAPMLDLESSSVPDSMHFYEPTWWMINGKRFHRTHLIIFRNAEVPDILKPSYQYGGVPVPQQIMERVYAAERTANEGPMLAMTKRTTVFKTNIEQAFANKTQFDERMAMWIANRDNQQVKLCDTDDEMEQFDTALGDLDAVIMTQYQIVAAAASVPSTKLLGTSPKGFGASGDYEIESYHETLESIQTHDLNPLMIRHLQLIVRSFVRPKFGIDPNIRAQWNPLDTPTAQENADIQLKNAQRDAALIEGGAIDGVDSRDRLILDPKSGYTGIASAVRVNSPSIEDDGDDQEVQDADEHWISTETGSHILLDDDGTVKAGMGGKFTGKNIKDVHGSEKFTSGETNAETEARNKSSSEGTAKREEAFNAGTGAANMANTDSWKSAGTLQYNRMLRAYLDRVNSGVDRGDDEKTFAKIEKDFAFLAANPINYEQRARDEAQAKREEDGE
jgi:phage-related protein (TIGR01555 family)